MENRSGSGPLLVADAPPRALVPGLLACGLLAVVYYFYARTVVPDGGHPFGHMLGIVGTVLMLAAETLYSARKRLGRLRGFGAVRNWLAAHIVMGMVGPFLILMHTGLKLHGLAGLALALTGVVAASGFVGRYLYAAIPHTLAGAEATRDELLAESQRLTEQIGLLARETSVQVQCLTMAVRQVGAAASRSPYLAVLERGYLEWRDRRRLHQELKKLKSGETGKMNELEWLLLRRRALDFQVEVLQAARSLLRVWQLLHIPLAVTMFAAVLIHIAATLYFRAGLFR